MSKKSLKTSNNINIKQNIFTLTSDAKIKISLWQLATNPIKQIYYNWQKLFTLGIPTALAMTITSLLFKRGILCSQSDTQLLSSPFCSDSPLNFYLDLIVRFLIIAFFATTWYTTALQNKTQTIKELFCFDFKKIKAFALMGLFFIINLSPLFALFLLIIRTPNPNWHIELLFFTSVAWIFLLPIIALRFYSYIAFSLAGEKLPSIKTTWNTTAGNMLKLLLGASLIVFLALFLFMQYYGAIQGLDNIGIWTAFIAEFEYDVLVILFMTLLINYCHTQKELLFAGDYNDQK